MLKNTIKKVFDIREGELHVALLMQGYIFLVIATLLIIKPTVNALFISDLGVENLPYGYLMVAITAVITSYFYSKITELFSLLPIIKFTLLFSLIALLVLGALLHLNLIEGWVLYGFYIGVAIYAVLATSQFWVLANLVFNVREAKRLFSFIGAGAIMGGIFGGYLTSLLAPYIGNENLIFVAAFLVVLCFPILNALWKARVSQLNTFKRKKRSDVVTDNPIRLIRKSKHLSYLAIIIAVGVIIAKLVDYQFSFIASNRITDSDELTAFFGFWLSTFNVISLALQLFLTRKIVGVWGVGFSLLLLPILIFFGGLLFLSFPELWVIIILKAVDGSLKQSVHKSAMELIALPLPFQLKKKTKSFIDVVVDSVATGIAGCILIFLIKGLDVSENYIMLLIIALSCIWGYYILKVRKEYFLSFRRNLDQMNPIPSKKEKSISKESFLKGMERVFREGKEKEILFMLTKAREVNDKRLIEPICALLHHPSNAVKTAVLQNLFYLNEHSIAMEVQGLLKTEDDEVVMAALEYLLLHADRDESIVFDTYLDHSSEYISGAAFICLAKESRDNSFLKARYDLHERIEKKATQIQSLPEAEREKEYVELITIIGWADYKNRYDDILKGMHSSHLVVQKTAIQAAGNTLNNFFTDRLLEMLSHKALRETLCEALTNYGPSMINVLQHKTQQKEISIDVKRAIPIVIEAFASQKAVDSLFDIFITSEDLTIRLRCIQGLLKLKAKNPTLHFDKSKLAQLILDECKIYDQTLISMHTQIIVHYLKRKKNKLAVSDKELNARESLMELLERRLDAGLERIFKLLELKYSEKDIQMAYKGILSDSQEKRTNAIEFLDIILNPNLKSTLIPIVELTILDTSSEEVIASISKNRHTEFECFETLLKGRDLKLKLAVLFLMEQLADNSYLLLVERSMKDDNEKVKSFAENAFDAIVS